MHWLRKFVFAATLALPVAGMAGTPATLYKNPNCGCCDEYVKHLRQNGFDVKVVATRDLNRIKDKYNVPEKLEGCHTTLIGAHVFEGHVPAEDIKRFLAERPAARGLAIPGMPVGTPGMPGKQRGPIHVYYLSDSSQPEIFTTH